MTKKSLFIRFYIVLLLLSLAIDVPLFPFRALHVSTMPLYFFLSLVGIVFPLYFFRDFLRFILERKITLLLAALFLLAGVISVRFSPLPEICGYKNLFQYGLLFCISFLLLFLFSLEGRSLGLFFLKSLVGLAVLLAAISFVELMNENFYHFLCNTFRSGEYQIFNGRPRVGATLTHPNIFGCFMSLGILVCLYLKRDARLKAGIFYPVVMALSLAMALSGSRNAVFVLLIPLLFLFLNKKMFKVVACTMILAALAMVVLTPSASRFVQLGKETAPVGKHDVGSVRSEEAAPGGFNTIDARLMLWQSALDMFRDHPLTGMGPGCYNVALKDYASENLLRVEKEKIRDRCLNAHNGFFNILAEFGLAGAAVWLAFAAYLIIRIIRRYGFYPPLPVHVLLLGIVLSFMPDAFFYNLFYMVVSLILFLFFAFPEATLACRPGLTPPDEPCP